MSVYLGDINDINSYDVDRIIQQLYDKGEYVKCLFLAVNYNKNKAIETIINRFIIVQLGPEYVKYTEDAEERKRRNEDEMTLAEEFVNSVDKKGWSPLMYASRYGFIEIAKILVSYGANKNFKTTDVGISPLLIACLFNQFHIVEFLIRVGADYKIQDKYGQNCFFSAVNFNSIKVVKYLLENHFFDANDVSNSGNSALMIACNRGYVEMVKLLLMNGADKNFVNRNGLTAFSVTDSSTEGQEIKGILQNFTTNMALAINEELDSPLDPGNLMDLSEYLGNKKPSGGKKRNKKSKKRRGSKKRRKNNKKKSMKRR